MHLFIFSVEEIDNLHAIQEPGLGIVWRHWLVIKSIEPGQSAARHNDPQNGCSVEPAISRSAEAVSPGWSALTLSTRPEPSEDFNAGLFKPGRDASRHGTDIGAPVPADFRLVADSA